MSRDRRHFGTARLRGSPRNLYRGMVLLRLAEQRSSPDRPVTQYAQPDHSDVRETKNRTGLPLAQLDSQCYAA